MDPLTPSKVIVSTARIHVRLYIPWILLRGTYVRTARQPDRQIDRHTEIFFCLFCVLWHRKHEHSSKGENFFLFHLCDYNTFSFYILRMWWESKKLQIYRYHEISFLLQLRVTARWRELSGNFRLKVMKTAMKFNNWKNWQTSTRLPTETTWKLLLIIQPMRIKQSLS